MKVLEEERLLLLENNQGLSQIDQGLSKFLYLGNIDAVRDWGHAKDYVEIQWKILQQEKPDDFVVATRKGDTY